MASFLRVVLAGTLAAAVVPWLLVIVVALDDSPRAPEPPVLLNLTLIGVVAFVLAAVGVALLGLPLAIALRRLRLENAQSYRVGGALAGYVLVWSVTSPLGGVAFGAILAILGAVGGGAAGHTWWKARRHRPDVYVRPFETLRPRPPTVRAAWTRYGTARTWPPRSAPDGDIGVSPPALVMSLVVLGLTAVVASASTGRFDWPPPQQYFPDHLRASTAIACDGAERGRIDHFAPLSDLEIDWYSTQLRAAHESSLYLATQRPGSTEARALRFTWLRSFHAPVVIRVDRLADGEMRLTAKRLSGDGGYNPGSIQAVVERNLSPAEVARLERVLSAGRVLELPPRDCRGGGDGARWILEANDHGAYHYVNRWTPDDGAVRETGLLLMSFTGWRFDRIY